MSWLLSMPPKKKADLQSCPSFPFNTRTMRFGNRSGFPGARLERQMHYWKQQLSGLPLLQSARDRPRPPVASYRGSHETLRVDAELTAALKFLAQREKTTLFMTLLAAFEVLLHRYSGQDDFAIGTLTAGRGRAGDGRTDRVFRKHAAVAREYEGKSSFSASCWGA